MEASGRSTAEHLDAPVRDQRSEATLHEGVERFPPQAQELPQSGSSQSLFTSAGSTQTSEAPAQAAAPCVAPESSADHVIILVVNDADALPDTHQHQQKDQGPEAQQVQDEAEADNKKYYQQPQQQQQQQQQELPRCPSATSSISAVQECRICLAADQQEDLVAPCSCTGTVKFAHMQCLKAWVSERQQLDCELCGKPYKAEVLPQLKPLVDAATAAANRRRRGSSMSGGAAADGSGLGGLDGLQELDGAAGTARAAPISWTRFWIHMAILVVLLVAVLYLALFVPITASDNFWLMFLWRAITVILPLFLIIRCVAALYAWRRAYMANRNSSQQPA